MSVRRSLAITILLAFAGGAASADSKVDWSQYIDKDAKTSRAPASSPPPVVTDSPAPKSAPRSAKKKVAAKSKSAKAKRTARRHK